MTTPPDSTSAAPAAAPSTPSAAPAIPRLHACPHCTEGRLHMGLDWKDVQRLGEALGSSEVAIDLAQRSLSTQSPKPCPTCAGRGKIPTALDLSRPVETGAGVIQNLLHGNMGSAVLIHSGAGSVRAQHYHKTDWHFCYVLDGLVMYTEADLVPPPGTKWTTSEILEHSKPDFSSQAVYVFGPGSFFYTPPMLAHRMYFPVLSSLVCLANRSRTHEDHEADLVRVKWEQVSDAEAVAAGVAMAMKVR